MSALTFYEESAPDFDRQGEQLRLEVLECSGRVLVGLEPHNGVSERLRCSLSKAEAKKVLQALDDAISRLAYL